MRSHASPAGEGFRALFGAPEAYVAEVLWRWIFGLTAVVIAIWSTNRFLQAIVISSADEAALATGFPLLLASAARHVAEQVPPLLFRLGAVLLPALALLWTFAGAAGRLVSTQRLIEYFGERYGLEQRAGQQSFAALLMLQFLRVVIGIAAIAGYFGCLVVAIMVARGGETPSVGRFLLTFVPLEFVVMMIASWLNWIVSLAPVFCVRDGRDWLAGLGDAIALSRSRAASFSSAALWLGLVRFVFATSLVVAGVVALGTLGSAPGWVVVAFMVALYAAWVVVADGLLTARLAAYVAIAQQERMPEPPPPTTVPTVWQGPLPDGPVEY